MTVRAAQGIASSALLVALVTSGAGCGKRCDTAEGCTRSCLCTDKEQGIAFTCAMTFNCDPDGKVCDPMYDRSCEDICNTYAAAAACGRQCVNDVQCLVRCTCEIENVGTILCEQPFACRDDVGVCEAAHALTTCESLCQTCYVGG